MCGARGIDLAWNTWIINRYNGFCCNSMLPLTDDKHAAIAAASWCSAQCLVQFAWKILRTYNTYTALIQYITLVHSLSSWLWRFRSHGISLAFTAEEKCVANWGSRGGNVGLYKNRYIRTYTTIRYDTSTHVGLYEWVCMRRILHGWHVDQTIQCFFFIINGEGQRIFVSC